MLGISTPSFNPLSHQIYWRCVPSPVGWAQVIITYLIKRRTEFLGTDENKIAEITRTCKRGLYINLPFFYRACIFFEIAMYHVLVYLSIGFYWVNLTLNSRSILNCVSLGIVMALFSGYLFSGTGTLIRYWRILTFWQAFVLVTQDFY